jgi:hypothetical protein
MSKGYIMNCKKEKIICLIFCVYLAIYLLHKYFISNNYNQYNPIQAQDPIINFFENEKRETNECAIIKKDVKQYTVKIDGSVYPKRVPLHLNKSIDFDCLQKRSKNIKKILVWNNWWGKKEYGTGIATPFKKNNCPITNCELTDDKKTINDADFVIVHAMDPADPIPKNKPSNQRWIIAWHESPSYAVLHTNYLFNYTSSFYIDDDFPDYYESESRIYWAENKEFDENRDYTDGKTG